MGVLADRDLERAARRETLPRPGGPWWWPPTWIRLLVWHWKLGGPVSAEERRGYLFWGPTILLVLGIELLATVSEIVGQGIQFWKRPARAWKATALITPTTMTATPSQRFSR